MNTRLETASCRLPLTPWPLVHPPASRAPSIITAPPRKATASRLPTPGPNRRSHREGTASRVRSPDSRELRSAPTNTPSTSIHSQPIFSGFPSDARFVYSGCASSTPGTTAFPASAAVSSKGMVMPSGWLAVANANQLATQWADLGKTPINAVLKALDQVPAAQRTGVRNNVGGHWNHSHFWALMTPGGAKAPGGDVKSGIDGAFGGLDKLKERMNAAAMGRFGSGWAWLIVNKDGKFEVVSTANQDTPLELGARNVLIGVDVWEHAYYLKYQNRRADYLGAWWNTVNWDKVAANLKATV